MKNLLHLFLILLSNQAFTQALEVVGNEIRSTAYEGKSYIYVNSITIRPPTSGSYQFKVSAATDGVFFIRPYSQVAPPTTDKNFVREENVLINGVVEENQINNLSDDNLAVKFKYIDGMGREIETVSVRASPGGHDVVTAGYYDNMGYNTIKYLPYSHDQNNGAFRASYASEVSTFYTATDAIPIEPLRPFNQTIYEASSLGKEEEVYGPGNDWFVASRRKQVKTWIDASNTRQKWIFVSESVAPILATYDSLQVNETIDEENHATREFVNKRGQTVLKQQQASGDYLNNPQGVTWSETYYCYDDLGRLRYTIPPEAASRAASEYHSNETIKQNFLNRWCFKYRYDELYNQIARWVPGWTDWEYIVYDKWNREILRQSPAQRASNEWLFTKYDRLNRPIITGLWTTTDSVQTIRANAFTSSVRHENSTSSSEGYTLTLSYPTSIAVSNLLSITYYDDYTFLSYPNWDTDLPVSTYNPEYISGFPQASEFLTNVKGHETGRKVRVLDQSRWLNSVTRYDNKYRPVQTTGENYLGGYDRTTTKYNFVGKVKKALLQHNSSFDAVSVLREFEYDKNSLLIRNYHTVGSGPRILLAEHDYNELGKLVEKNVHSIDEGGSFLQSVDYRYNIRGLVTSINNSGLTNDGILNNDATDIFGMEMLYNPSNQITIGTGPSAFTPVKQYNGKISALKWKVDTQEGSSKSRAYGFEYDALERLTKSYYGENNSGQWIENLGMFDEAIKSYDKNGNIQGIQRFGRVEQARKLIDSTYYGYNYVGSGIPNYNGQSNRLMKVKDSGTSLGFKDGVVQSNEEFLYDPSGNLIFDLNKQISNVVYNHLNFPKQIEFTRPTGSVDRIKYFYDGLGTKLRMQVWKGGTTGNDGTLVSQIYYNGDIQYSQDQNTPTKLSFISTPEGRVIKNGSAFEYEYFYKDHQGNIRATYGITKKTISYKATMERPIDRPLESPPGSTLGDKEEGDFLNVASTRFPNSTYNYTKPSSEVASPVNSAITNGFIGKPIGPAKEFTVSVNDKVHVEVFAKYAEVTGSSEVVTSAALITAVTGTFGINSGEAIFSGFQTNVPAIPGSGNASATLPKAYLACLFFDSNNVFVPSVSGAVAISTSAYNAFEKLERNITAPVDGRLFVYVANETNVASTVSVYFDEMLIVHQKNDPILQVTQASDYYPFGLAFNVFQKDRFQDDFTKIQTNRYGFQGQELQKDLDLGWSAFKSRMHDPVLGRFNSVDPLSDKYVYNSPYAFQENKLGSGVELEGNELLPSQLAFDVAKILYDISPLGTAERTAYAMRDYAANEIQYATTRGEQYQQALTTPNSGRTIHNIDMTYHTNKLKAKGDLIIVGMEWFAMSAGGATNILEGGLLRGLASPSGRMVLYKSSSAQDISLGIRNLNKKYVGYNQLELFSKQFDNAPFMDDWAANGLRSVDTKLFIISFEEATTNALKTGGKIRMDLSGYNIKDAMKAKGKHWTEVGYTDWEFNQIVGNKELLDGTEFYRDGKLLSTDQVMAEVGAALSNAQ